MSPGDAPAPSPVLPRRPGPDSYDVFISYCHKPDGRVVKALRGSLEQFNNPWYRRRRWRVFHDASSLSANPDLWNSILRALRGSTWLLVVLSPEAARSPWIEKEVAWWLAEKPDPLASLMIAITDGDPPWNGQTPVDPAQQVLPPSLTDAYPSPPRWVDLRELRRSLDARQPRRRRRQALTAAAADFAAAVLGKPKDLLYGEATRRYRRNIRAAVIAVVISSLTAVSAAAGFLNARQQQHRAEAQNRLAVSRQLIAESAALQGAQPGLARQLVAAAWQINPTDQAWGTLLGSPVMPGMWQLPDDVDALAHRPDGRILAVASGTSISLIDVTTDIIVGRLPALSGEVTSVAVDREGRLFAGSGDGTVEVWEIRDAAAPRQLARTRSGTSVAQLSLSADGRTLATVEAGQTVRLFAFDERAGLRPVITLAGAGTTGLPSVALSKDGRSLAAADENFGIRRWDLADPRRPRRLSNLKGHTNPVGVLSFNPDGTMLVSGGDDDTVRLWAVADPDRPQPLPTLIGHTSSVQALSFTADGHRLASADFTGAVRIWETSDPLRPSLVTELSGHTDFVNTVDFAPDGRTLVTGSSDSTARRWQVGQPGSSVPRATLPAGPSKVLVFTPSGLMAGSQARLWDFTDVVHPHSFAPHFTGWPRPDVAAVSHDSKVLAAPAGEEGVAFWDFAAPEKTRPVGRLPLALGTADSLAFAPSGRTLAVAGAEAGLLLTEVRDPAHSGPVRTVPLEPPKDGPAKPGDVAFSRDGTELAIVRHTGLEVWNVRDWKRTKPSRVAVEGETGQVGAVAFDPTTSRMATADSDGLIRIWTETEKVWRQTAAFNGHRDGGSALTFSPDGRLLVSGGADRAVRLWRTPPDGSPSPLTTFTGHQATVWALAVSADGHQLASADLNGEVRIWDLDPTALLRTLCRYSGPRITRDQWVAYVGDIPYRPPCP
ncbi:TIR domain-containing protein [Micromonospora sp. NPDC050686]|uniref:TIR domain-containing protein n=1 Tax=Micromonospora sp. NPDC050686 TaxID=3154631 RepID=UPI0033F1ACB2